MWVFNKSFENIEESDIRGLLSRGITENQNLEYKLEFGQREEDKKEMSRDISSMANAYGGYLIVGIREDGETGAPLEITGVENAENERDRIMSSCLSNIEPRIPGLKIRTVPIQDRNPIILIFIPRSTRAPHAVRFGGGRIEFWKRHDRQKSPMPIEEIREAFLRTENIRKDVDKFIQERRKEILEEILIKPTYVIGAAPIMVKDEIIDIRDTRIREMLRNPADQVATPWNLDFRGNTSSSTPTLYGLKIEDSNRRIELFRNGYLELRVKINEPNRAILATLVIDYAVNFYRLFKGLVEYLGLNEPFIGCLSLYNIRGFHLKIPRSTGENGELSSPWSKPHLEIPSMQILSLHDPDKTAKDFVDRVWNAFGYDEAPPEMLQYRGRGN